MQVIDFTSIFMTTLASEGCSELEKVNKYCHRSHIAEQDFQQIIRYFAMDLEASRIAELTGISRNSVNRILKALRMRLAEYCENQSPFPGAIEKDERSDGKGSRERGRDANGRVPVFWVLKHQGNVYTQILLGCSRKMVEALIKGKVDFNIIIHSDSDHSYEGLVDLGCKRNHRVNHGKDAINNKSHDNGIDNYWAIAKTRLSKFRGLNKNSFYLYLKETEFRFNHRDEDLYELILLLLREDPLKLS